MQVIKTKKEKVSVLPDNKVLTADELRLLERINDHLHHNPDTDCIEYRTTNTKYTDEHKVTVPTVQISKGKFSTVAKVMFELFFCKVPGVKRIRHTCNNRRCVSPQHLTLSMSDTQMKALLPSSVYERLRGRKIHHEYNHNAKPRYDRTRMTIIKPDKPLTDDIKAAECLINKHSSRVCTRGTKGCIMIHDEDEGIS